jgi:hypothetical protein
MIDTVFTVPWGIRIERPRDLLRLEEALRALLRCDGSACTFLQSAEYARLKIDTRHALRTPNFVGAPRSIRVPGSTLVLHVDRDGRSVIVQNQQNLVLETPAADTAPPRLRLRAPPPAARIAAAPKTTLTTTSDEEDGVDEDDATTFFRALDGEPIDPKTKRRRTLLLKPSDPTGAALVVKKSRRASNQPGSSNSLLTKRFGFETIERQLIQSRCDHHAAAGLNFQTAPS